VGSTEVAEAATEGLTPMFWVEAAVIFVGILAIPVIIVLIERWW
jgi:hypothetical protein